MQAAISESSPQKAGRRVLGEKTANASLTPATKRVADANSQKFQSTAIPFNALSKKTSSSSKTREFSSDARHAGQKRSIDQVVEDIKEAESEPRKLLMTSQTEEEAEFDIFNDENGTESRQPKALEATTSQQTDEGKARENMATNPEKSKDGSLSRVPTEPAARKVFIQQRAALARSRLQSAMRRVEDKSLDRALSQFEANSRPFLRTLSSSSSASSSRQQQPQQQQISQNSSPTKQKRVLLPPLPLQPRSRPVRSSAQTTAPSPSSGSLSIVSLPETDDEAEPIDSNDDDENDKTPKQSDFKQQDNVAESHGVGVSVSQESDSVMDKLVKWTQSSTDSIPTVEA